MELSILTSEGKSAKGKIKVSETVFDREFNEPLIHQVVTAYRAGSRQGTKANKSRSDVRGSGAKPWRQKGTGRARAGTKSSPIWRSGGVTFASKPRDFSQKVNKKMYKGAMQAIVSELIRQERLIVVEDFSMEQPKTRDLVAKLKQLGLHEALIVTHSVSENLYLSSRNLYRVDVCDVHGLNPVDMIAIEKVIITKDALKTLEDMLA